MTTRNLGSTGPATAPIGLGLMGMSGMYGPADRDEGIATVHAALDAGITLLDTGDFYGMGHNELLLRDALAARDRGEAIISVKFGALRDPANGWGGMDTRPEAIRNFVAYSLTRLGTDHIDIYRPARLDPDVPIEETVGAIKALIDEGYVRHVGLSEVGADTIRRAAAVHPIADLQIEYSLISRGIEDEILATTRELGIGITAYGVLSRGLLSGHWSAQRDLPATRLPRPRAALPAREPRAQPRAGRRAAGDRGGARRDRRPGGDRLGALARRRHRAGDRRAAARPAAGGARRARRTLDDDALARIEDAVPEGAAAGDRYNEHAMAQLDSER